MRILFSHSTCSESTLSWQIISKHIQQSGCSFSKSFALDYSHQESITLSTVILERVFGFSYISTSVVGVHCFFSLFDIRRVVKVKKTRISEASIQWLIWGNLKTLSHFYSGNVKSWSACQFSDDMVSAISRSDQIQGHRGPGKHKGSQPGGRPSLLGLP